MSLFNQLFGISFLLTQGSSVGMWPYLNNRLDCRGGDKVKRLGLEEEVSLWSVLEIHPQDWNQISLVISLYLLPTGHPATDGRHKDGAEQDLSRMVDQQRDWDQREVLIARKHNLQHGDTWREVRLNRDEEDILLLCLWIWEFNLSDVRIKRSWSSILLHVKQHTSFSFPLPDNTLIISPFSQHEVYLRAQPKDFRKTLTSHPKQSLTILIYVRIYYFITFMTF